MSTRMVGRTVVRFDPDHGPYRFERPPGVEVPCVCDPGHLVCAFHAPADFDPALWELIPESSRSHLVNEERRMT
jgi:hypothetical protein